MKHKISPLLHALLLWLMSMGVSSANGTPPIVLATSKPLHSLAASVTQGVSEAQLLIKGNASPHLFQLKPSHIKALAEADVVLWAGLGVERFIPDTLENVAVDSVSLELASMPSVVLHKARSDRDTNNKDSHSDRQQVKNESESIDNLLLDKEIDYHVWLDPHNAMVAVNVLADQLSQLDPDNAESYQSNAADLNTELVAVHSEIEKLMSDSKGKSYLIYHDSIQYFEKAFGLGEAIVVTRQPQVQAGGRRLKQLRQRVADNSPGCIFSELQFRALSLQVLASDLNLKTVKIDPLASEFNSGPELYSEWLQHTASQVADCLR